ncbi:CoA transferase [Saccharomonospora sp. NPDC046836]|uniref:CoA transferase n=1 Tax=Saccharomonospora sp. NPDC046836 TaxID=3156921 RepID=UPI0033DF4614
MSRGPLDRLRVAVSGGGPAVRHAARMLSSLGATVLRGDAPMVDLDGVIDGDGTLMVPGIPAVQATDASAEADWAASGAMALTGRADGPPLPAPGFPASAARGALLATELLARIAGRTVSLPGAQVLAARAVLAGLRRGAPWSAGRAFGVLRAADGWLGVNLARASDVELLPAWLETDTVPGEPWSVLAERVACRAAGPLAERARLLGLPATQYPDGSDEQLSARGQTGDVWPFVLNGRVHRAAGPGRARPVLPRRRWELPPTLVVDLSSLWAGPLCGHLLTMLGARVVKVESVHRPDGARFGSAAFYDLLHSGQESVALDFRTAEGRAALAGLVAAADVVIESSRPRALRQLGVVADDVLSATRAKCWVSITAYGRTGPWSNAVGFGDDTAVAGGLLAFDPATGVPAPCGDAIADPLTGVHAALVALACRLGGGTWLADLALREHVAATVHTGLAELGERDERVVAVPAAPRSPERPAAALGADTARVLAELGLP